MIQFDPAAIRSVVDYLGPQNCERLVVGAMSIGGLGAGWLTIKGSWLAARLGYKAARAGTELAAKFLKTRQSELASVLLDALDDPHASFIGAKLRTVRLVCDFGKLDLLVGKDEVTPLLTKREAARVWAKARQVRQRIEEQEAEEMRTLIVLEIKGEGDEV